MLLKTLSIENFRGIEKLVLELDRTTVLVGKNNTGKTSVLEALHICMSRGLSRRASPFSEYDFHLASKDADPADAPPLVLTLTFEETDKDEWPDEIAQAFPNAIQTLDDDRQRLCFRASSKYDKVTRDFAVEWSFLNKSGHPLPTAKQQKLVTDMQQLALPQLADDLFGPVPFTLHRESPSEAFLPRWSHSDWLRFSRGRSAPSRFLAEMGVKAS